MNELKTRIILKNDELSNWNKEGSLILKKGEIGLARVEVNSKDPITGDSVSVPTYLMKVGDGNTAFSSLNWLAAPAADVHNWAKKSEAEFTEWVKTLITVDDISLTNYYTKDEVNGLLDGKANVGDAYTKDEADNLLNDKADKSTTLEGYGITDAYTKGQADNLLAGKADKSTTLSGYGITDAYTKDEANDLLDGKANVGDSYTKGEADDLLNDKADKSTTLEGYGITDAYTKGQADNLLVGKADKSTTLSGYGITDAYTKDEANDLLDGKANKATTLEGYGITDAYTKDEANDLLDGKANKATTLEGYGITDAYTKDDVDGLLNDAKDYTDTVKESLLGTGELVDTYDTLVEIGTWIKEHGVEATELAEALVTETTNREEADETVLENAKNYTDGKVADTLEAAKQYADSLPHENTTYDVIKDGGLKMVNNQFGIDDSIEFIFDCGDSGVTE